MGARNIYVEHRYNGRLLKAVRLDARRKRVTIGASRDADIRLLGQEIGGIQAVLEYEDPQWTVYDLGANFPSEINGKPFIEHPVKDQTVVKFGSHELQITPREGSHPLFVLEKPTKGAPTHQQVVILYKGKVVQTEILGKTDAFTYLYAGEDLTFNAATSEAWVSSLHGDLEVRQRWVHVADGIGRDPVAIDPELTKSILAVFGVLLFLSPILYFFRNQDTQPAPSKITQMIYDAKVIKKKREQSIEIKTKMVGSNNNRMSENQNESGQMATGPKTISTKVISNIKASGLSKLIGKIALRAGNTSVMVQSVGTPEQNAKAHGVSAGTMIQGKLETKGEGYKISNVATGGKAGGSTAYKDGANMAAGSVGTGEVGVIDEETVIEGGLDREVIASVIKDELGQIRYCYERNLSANPNLMGKVSIKFTIGSGGDVTSQQIGATTLNNAMVEGCILRRVARWKFPQPKGGTSVLVTYPFLFKALN